MTWSLCIIYVMWMAWRSFIFLRKFHFVACNAWIFLMRGFRNLLAYVKVTKNVERPSCQIIANDFFCNLSKLDKLLKSWYDLKLRYNCGSYNFSSWKKRLNNMVEKSPNLWSNSHWVICWYEQLSNNYWNWPKKCWKI